MLDRSMTRVNKRTKIASLFDLRPQAAIQATTSILSGGCQLAVLMPESPAFRAELSAAVAGGRSIPDLAVFVHVVCLKRAVGMIHDNWRAVEQNSVTRPILLFLFAAVDTLTPTNVISVGATASKMRLVFSDDYIGGNGSRVCPV